MNNKKKDLVGYCAIGMVLMSNIVLALCFGAEPEMNKYVEATCEDVLNCLPQNCSLAVNTSALIKYDCTIPVLSELCYAIDQEIVDGCSALEKGE